MDAVITVMAPGSYQELGKDGGEGVINARRPAGCLRRPEVLGGGETQRDDSAGVKACGALGEKFPACRNGSSLPRKAPACRRGSGPMQNRFSSENVADRPG